MGSLEHKNESSVFFEKTKDGSHTLFNPVLNEHYHSIHGAMSESMHIFIKHGLHEVSEEVDPVYLLEVGFGTGLNAILTYKHQLEGSKIIYHTLEPFPLSNNIISGLNYKEVLSLNEDEINIFESFHHVPFEKEHTFNRVFSFKKFEKGLMEVGLQQNFYHLVYFDAFAPEKQPDLWTPDVFQKIYRLMTKGGSLVTYCCKGDVKRGLKTAGFEIEKLKGPPGGKREMLRAKK